jgi:predicted methyltransferase MtxX (methanogen marker protein 4)
MQISLSVGICCGLAVDSCCGNLTTNSLVYVCRALGLGRIMDEDELRFIES